MSVLASDCRAEGSPERLQALLDECVQCLAGQDVAAAEGVCAVLPALLLACLDLSVADAAMVKSVLEALSSNVQLHVLPGVRMPPSSLQMPPDEVCSRVHHRTLAAFGIASLHL
jgi:hypothetical protein